MLTLVCVAEISNLLVVTKNRAPAPQTPMQESQFIFHRILKDEIKQVKLKPTLLPVLENVGENIVFKNVSWYIHNCEKLPVLYWTQTSGFPFLLNMNKKNGITSHSAAALKKPNLKCCAERFLTRVSPLSAGTNQEEHLGRGTRTNIYQGTLRVKGEQDNDGSWSSSQEVKVVLKLLGSGHRDISLVRRTRSSCQSRHCRA